MTLESIESAVLELIAQPTYQPVKLKVIAKKLDIAPEDRAALRRVVRQLSKTGQLVYGANHVVMPPGVTKRNTRTLVGRFRSGSRGSGHVRPVDVPLDHDRKDDVFIFPVDTADAAQGDLVVVELTGRTHRQHGNPIGKVVKIIERQSEHLVGAYFEIGDDAYVRIDGDRFPEPVPVADARTRKAKPGDSVVVEIVRYPAGRDPGEAVMTEVLGPRGQSGVDTLLIMRQFGLPDAFPEDVLADARRQAELFDEANAQGIPEGRRDFTAETIITIDPKDARDFDDAISLALMPNGHWKLGVHIADVAHFVPTKSPLDREARNRATSVYLPDRVIPMLPELISNGLASLQPNRVRYAISAWMEFSPEGQPVHTELTRSAIESKHRFTYEEVDEFLEDPEAFRERCKPEVHELLGRMRDLSRILRERRKKAGALELHLPEVKITLDSDNQVDGAQARVQTESHQIIEEFMLSANEAVARRLDQKKIAFLRRVHAPPEPEKLETLEEFVRELGFKVDNLRDRFQLQGLLTKTKDDPRSRAISYATLRSFKRAVYSPEPEGHYALASDCYCHFTSPIRRYPDLTIHRLVTSLIEGRAPESKFADLVILGEHCSDREQRAEEAERELTKLKLLNFLHDRIGLELEAVITGVERFGLFVQGRELPAEGLMHVSALPEDFYRLDEEAHTLVGNKAGNRYRLGDAVKVAVARVDLSRRQLDFRLVGVEPQRRPNPLKTKKPTFGPKRYGPPKGRRRKR